MGQVAEKYKQTEIGLIPSDWEVLKLGEICSFENGDRSSNYPAANEFVSNGIPFINAGHVSDGIISLKTMDYIPDSVFNRLSGGKVLAGDILFCLRGSLGKFGLVSSDFGQGAIASSLVIIRPKLGRTTTLYLSNYFKSEICKRMIELWAGGAAQPNLGARELEKFLIPLSSKPEQSAIATALNDADSYIDSLEKLIAKKRLIKQGAMQQLLQPKEGWVVKKLKDLIFSFQNGYGFSAEGYVKDGTPIVTMAQVGLDGSFQFDENKVNYWKLSDFNSLKSFHLNDGDVIIAMTDVTPDKNLIGRMTIVKTNQTLLLNQRVGHLRIDKSKVNTVVLIALSNMKKWRLYCISSASLGVQANIGTRDILNGNIELPNIDEQNVIAEILSDMDKEIQAMEKKLEKARQIKQGMMQQLLTGKIRLI